MEKRFKLTWAKAVSEWNKAQPFRDDLYGIPKKGGEFYDEIREMMGKPVAAPTAEPMADDAKKIEELERKVRSHMVGRIVVNPKEWREASAELEKAKADLQKKKSELEAPPKKNEEGGPKLERPKIFSPEPVENEEMAFEKFVDDFMKEFLADTTKDMNKTLKIGSAEVNMRAYHSSNIDPKTKNPYYGVRITQKTKSGPKVFTPAQEEVLRKHNFRILYDYEHSSDWTFDTRETLRGKTVEKPAEVPAEKPAEVPAEKPAEKPREKPPVDYLEYIEKLVGNDREEKFGERLDKFEKHLEKYPPIQIVPKGNTPEEQNAYVLEKRADYEKRLETLNKTINLLQRKFFEAKIIQPSDVATYRRVQRLYFETMLKLAALPQVEKPKVKKEKAEPKPMPEKQSESEALRNANKLTLEEIITRAEAAVKMEDNDEKRETWKDLWAEWMKSYYGRLFTAAQNLEMPLAREISAKANAINQTTKDEIQKRIDKIRDQKVQAIVNIGGPKAYKQWTEVNEGLQNKRVPRILGKTEEKPKKKPEQKEIELPKIFRDGVGLREFYFGIIDNTWIDKETNDPVVGLYTQKDRDELEDYIRKVLGLRYGNMLIRAYFGAYGGRDIELEDDVRSEGLTKAANELKRAKKYLEEVEKKVAEYMKEKGITNKYF